MERRTGRKTAAYLAASAALLLVAALWGCPKKPDEASLPGAVETGSEAASHAEEGAGRQGDTMRTDRADAAPEGIQPVYFDFDRATIRGDARPVLHSNAEWLKAHPTATVKIEGNCDERGTIEYNQALGQRRAAAARKYLVDLGISARRLSIISYGKEKPACTDPSEDCWQRNRRDEFVLISE